MKLAAGLLLILVALAPLGLGLLWFVGAAGGGEWDVEYGGTWIDGLLVGLILIGVAAVVGALGVRLIRTSSR
jgi:hypothetical protein